MKQNLRSCPESPKTVAKLLAQTVLYFIFDILYNPCSALPASPESYAAVADDLRSLKSDHAPPLLPPVPQVPPVGDPSCRRQGSGGPGGIEMLSGRGVGHATGGKPGQWARLGVLGKAG